MKRGDLDPGSLHSTFTIQHSTFRLRLSATLPPVRKWWVGLLGVLLPAAVLAASPFKTITPELRASLTADYTIEVVVTPHEGVAWSRLAKRVTVAFRARPNEPLQVEPA